MNLIGKKFQMGGVTWTVSRHEGENIWGTSGGENYCMWTDQLKIWDVKHWLE